MFRYNVSYREPTDNLLEISKSYRLVLGQVLNSNPKTLDSKNFLRQNF
ncbi:hypothetical protein LEP1GSC059_4480 [Leptospira noguchii serovar Panama str. CZ214]|uniref:Uncharacterized protein n=1 Tax=Leptospira noguchii serovar Panama str. CZ214 TaxID=1001595 RepID=T0GXU6_9LEPT|nr:hypothetical protein LEP1GSC059_4480 [Leptospira noguchii serovar Panama str. CZ214]